MGTSATPGGACASRQDKRTGQTSSSSRRCVEAGQVVVAVGGSETTSRAGQETQLCTFTLEQNKLNGTVKRGAAQHISQGYT